MRRFAALMAVLAWSTLALQLWLSVDLSMREGRGAFSGVTAYFSFFTVLMNILVACALTAGARQRPNDLERATVPPRSVRVGDVARWAVVPPLYLAYALARGAATGRYPYYFIDASKLGYPAVFTNATLILAGLLAVALALVGINRARSQR